MLRVLFSTWYVTICSFSTPVPARLGWPVKKWISVESLLGIFDFIYIISHFPLRTRNSPHTRIYMRKKLGKKTVFASMSTPSKRSATRERGACVLPCTSLLLMTTKQNLEISPSRYILESDFIWVKRTAVYLRQCSMSIEWVWTLNCTHSLLV